MIRNPFKKAFSSRRSLKQEDAQFEHEIQRLHHMQAVSKRLYKNMAKCSEAESAQTSANCKVFSDLRASSCSKTEPLKSIVYGINSCSEELQGHYKDHKTRQEATFSDAMKRFHSAYKHLDIHIKQRESRLQDLDKQQAKLEKRQASQSAKLEHTQRKVASAKADFEKINEKLMRELPQVYEKRAECFDPCLTAAMSSQLLYHKNCADTLKKSLNQLETAGKATEISLDDMFSQIKSLSIVGEPGQ